MRQATEGNKNNGGRGQCRGVEGRRGMRERRVLDGRRGCGRYKHDQGFALVVVVVRMRMVSEIGGRGGPGTEGNNGAGRTLERRGGGV